MEVHAGGQIICDEDIAYAVRTAVALYSSSHAANKDPPPVPSAARQALLARELTKAFGTFRALLQAVWESARFEEIISTLQPAAWRPWWAFLARAFAAACEEAHQFSTALRLADEVPTARKESSPLEGVAPMDTATLDRALATLFAGTTPRAVVCQELHAVLERRIPAKLVRSLITEDLAPQLLSQGVFGDSAMAVLGQCLQGIALPPQRQLFLTDFAELRNGVQVEVTRVLQGLRSGILPPAGSVPLMVLGLATLAYYGGRRQERHRNAQHPRNGHHKPLLLAQIGASRAIMEGKAATKPGSSDANSQAKARSKAAPKPDPHPKMAMKPTPAPTPPCGQPDAPLQVTIKTRVEAQITAGPFSMLATEVDGATLEFCFRHFRVARPVPPGARSGFASVALALGAPCDEVAERIAAYLENSPASLETFFEFFPSAQPAPARRSALAAAARGTGLFSDGHAKALAELSGRRVLLIFGASFHMRACRVYAPSPTQAPDTIEHPLHILQRSELGLLREDIVLLHNQHPTGGGHIEPLLPGNLRDVLASMPVVDPAYRKWRIRLGANVHGFKCPAFYEDMSYADACLAALLLTRWRRDRATAHRITKTYGFWDVRVFDGMVSAAAALPGAAAFHCKCREKGCHGTGEGIPLHYDAIARRATETHLGIKERGGKSKAEMRENYAAFRTHVSFLLAEVLAGGDSIHGMQLEALARQLQLKDTCRKGAELAVDTPRRFLAFLEIAEAKEQKDGAEVSLPAPLAEEEKESEGLDPGLVLAVAARRRAAQRSDTEEVDEGPERVVSIDGEDSGGETFCSTPTPPSHDLLLSPTQTAAPAPACAVGVMEREEGRGGSLHGGPQSFNNVEISKAMEKPTETSTKPQESNPMAKLSSDAKSGIGDLQVPDGALRGFVLSPHGPPDAYDPQMPPSAMCAISEMRQNLAAVVRALEPPGDYEPRVLQRIRSSAQNELRSTPSASDAELLRLIVQLSTQLLYPAPVSGDLAIVRAVRYALRTYCCCAAPGAAAPPPNAISIIARALTDAFGSFDKLARCCGNPATYAATIRSRLSPSWTPWLRHVGRQMSAQRCVLPPPPPAKESTVQPGAPAVSLASELRNFLIDRVSTTLVDHFVSPRTVVGLLATGPAGDSARALLEASAAIINPVEGPILLEALQDFRKNLARDVQRAIEESSTPGLQESDVAKSRREERHVARKQEERTIQRNIQEKVLSAQAAGADPLWSEFTFRAFRGMAARAGLLGCEEQLGLEPGQVAQVVADHLRTNADSLSTFFEIFPQPGTAAERRAALVRSIDKGGACEEGHMKVLAEATSRRVLVFMEAGVPGRGLRVYTSDPHQPRLGMCHPVQAITGPMGRVDPSALVFFRIAGQPGHRYLCYVPTGLHGVLRSLPIVDHRFRSWSVRLGANKHGFKFAGFYNGMNYADACLAALLLTRWREDGEKGRRFAHIFGFWSEDVFEGIMLALARMPGIEAFHCKCRDKRCFEDLGGRPLLHYDAIARRALNTHINIREDRGVDLSKSKTSACRSAQLVNFYAYRDETRFLVEEVARGGAAMHAAYLAARARQLDLPKHADEAALREDAYLRYAAYLLMSAPSIDLGPDLRRATLGVKRVADVLGNKGEREGSAAKRGKYGKPGGGRLSEKEALGVTEGAWAPATPTDAPSSQSQ